MLFRYQLHSAPIELAKQKDLISADQRIQGLHLSMDRLQLKHYLLLLIPVVTSQAKKQISYFYLNIT